MHQSWKKDNFFTRVIRTPWVLLNMKRFRLPSMLGSGSSLSFMREDVFQRIKKLGLPHVAEATKTLSDSKWQSVQGNPGGHYVDKASGVFVESQILVFEHCPIPCVLRVDFLALTKLRMDFATQRYSFAFRSEKEFYFQSLDFCRNS
jgi:hypothetical protein